MRLLIPGLLLSGSFVVLSGCSGLMPNHLGIVVHHHYTQQNCLTSTNQRDTVVLCYWDSIQQHCSTWKRSCLTEDIHHRSLKGLCHMSTLCSVLVDPLAGPLVETLMDVSFGDIPSPGVKGIDTG